MWADCVSGVKSCGFGAILVAKTVLDGRVYPGQIITCANFCVFSAQLNPRVAIHAHTGWPGHYCLFRNSDKDEIQDE